MKKLIWSRVLLGIGIVLFICYGGGIIYFYNFCTYSPYASAGAELDVLIHSVLFLPFIILCLGASLLLYIFSKKSKTNKK